LRHFYRVHVLVNAVAGTHAVALLVFVSMLLPLSVLLVAAMLLKVFLLSWSLLVLAPWHNCVTA
jgi:hypothetical protein